MTSEADAWDDLETEGQPRRKTRRIDVSDRDDCLIFIDGDAFFIRNVSLAGIGLQLPIEKSFQLSEVIGDVLECKVQIAGQIIKNLEYRLVYLSPAQGENMFCGMEWINHDLDTEEAFQNAIDKL